MPDGQETRADRIIAGLKNSRWFAPIIAGAVIVIGAAAFTNAVSSLATFLGFESHKSAPTVKPIMNVYGVFDSTESRASISIGNNGLGLAVITQFRAYLDRRDVKARSSIELSTAMNGQLPGAVDVDPTWTFVNDGAVLLPGAKVTLFSVPTANIRDARKLMAFVKRVDFKMKICSASDDCVDYCPGIYDVDCRTLQ